MHGKGWHMGWTYGTAGSFSCDTGICAFTGWDHFLPCLQLLSVLIHLVLTIGLVLVFFLLFFFLISNALLKMKRKDPQVHRLCTWDAINLHPKLHKSRNSSKVEKEWPLKAANNQTWFVKDTILAPQMNAQFCQN